MQLNQRVEGVKGSAVKVLKNQRNRTDLSKYLTNKMGSSVTVQFKRSPPGRDDLLEKDFTYRRGSSLSSREGLSPVYKHTNHE